MATGPSIGIIITGDSSELIAAADAAQKKLAEMSGKTVQQMQRDNANILKDAKRNQWQQFQMFQQIQDVGIQIAGGQNPLLALAQQGSQLTAIYGSAANALKAVGSTVVGFVTSPVALAAATVAGLAYAFLKGDQQSAEFRKSLALTGNAAGLTEGSFNSLVKTVAATTDEGAGHVRDFAQAMVSSGRFGSDALEKFTTLAVNMASATGATVDATVQSLASMQSAPARWAEEQNKRLHFMTAAQLEYITRLEAFGQREKAVQVVREELMKKFPKEAEENLGMLEKVTKDVGKWFSDMWDKILNVRRAKTLPDQIAELKDQIAQMRNPNVYTDAVTDSKNRKKLPSYEAQLSMLELQQSAQLLKVQTESKKATNEELKRENDLYVQKLKPMQDGLKIAIAEYQAKQSIRGIELEIFRLRGEESNFDQPSIQARYAQVIASQELLKIEKQRSAVVKEIDVLKGASNKTPEEQYAKRNKALELSGKLNDIDNDSIRVKIQLQQELNSLAYKKSMIDFENAENNKREYESIQNLNLEALIRAKDMRNELKYSKYAIPEQADYRRRLDQINEMQQRAEEAIRSEKNSLDEKQKKQLLNDSEITFGRERLEAENQYKEALDRTYNAQRGVNEAMNEYALNSKRAGVAAYNAVMTIQNGLEDVLTTAITKGKLDFTSLTDHIINEVVRMKIVKPILANIFSAGGDIGGGGSSFGDFLSTIFSAKGNAFGPAGLIPFAKGGVVTRPTIFPFAKGTGIMGEAGPEAIMPLGRDNQGRLGVRGGGGGNVQVNIINNAGAQVTQTTRQQGDDTFIDVMVSAVEDRMAGNVATASGSMYHAISNTFGMNRAVS